MIYEIFQTVKEQLSDKVKKTLTIINLVIILYAVIITIANFNAIRSNTSLGDQLAFSEQQLEEIRASANDLTATVERLTAEQLKSAIYTEQLESDNKDLKRLVEESNDYNARATAANHELGTLESDSIRIVEESLELIKGFRETEEHF